MAKSRSIGGIYASLSLRDGGFKSGLKSARASLNKFGSMALKSGAVAAGAMAAGMVVGTKGALSMVDAVGDLSAATGVGIADMMKLQRSYADGGRDAGKAAADIGKMQKSIFTAASGGKDPFETIGLSAKELLKLNPADQFDAIGAAIMRIQNPTERTAKAMEIFGKSGAGLATVFGTLKDSEKVLGKMPELAQKFGGAIDQANDALGRLPVKSDQFFVGFTAGIIGELLPALGMIDEHDFTQVGENLGLALAKGLDETQWQIWGIAGMEEITKLGAALANTLEIAGRGIKDNAEAGAETFGKSVAKKAFYAFHNMTSADDPKWKKFKETNGENGEKMGGGFEENLAKKFAKWEMPKHLQDTLDVLSESKLTLQKSLDRKTDKRRDKAAAVGAPEPIVNPITDLAARELDMSTLAASAPKSIDVNEYQRRGLSLGGSISSKTDDKQVTLLTKIHDVLKSAKNNGELTW